MFDVVGDLHFAYMKQSDVSVLDERNHSLVCVLGPEHYDTMHLRNLILNEQQNLTVFTIEKPSEYTLTGDNTYIADEKVICTAGFRCLITCIFGGR